MQLQQRGIRYAHCEGYTDFCYSSDGVYILTCGEDGDTRLWKNGVDDHDPKSFRHEKVFIHNGLFSVRAYTFPDLNEDGIVTRFTSSVTHMDINATGTLLIAGSCDMTIRICQVNEYNDRIIRDHKSAILSVALDPIQEYLASSSCDGTVRIWSMNSLKCVISWPFAPKCNDYSRSPTLCRMSWHPNDGKLLAIPTLKTITLMIRNTWKEIFSIDESVLGEFSIVQFSPCGQMLASSTNKGEIIIFDVNSFNLIGKYQDGQNTAICSLSWNPVHPGELAYCDVLGQLNIEENTVEDTSAISIKRIKAEAGFELTEEEGDVFTGKILSKTSEVDSEDDNSIFSQNLVEIKSKLQNAFQPGSSPVSLQHRFMVWNSIGIVICHHSETESSIEVNFHDSSVHHSLLISNIFDCTMAALNDQALVLASFHQNDLPSKICCHHYMSWDGQKEWSIDLPENEDVEAIALGNNWIAAATSLRYIRIFSLSGVQKEILSLPGPIVCMVGSESLLLIVYHAGAALPGEQFLGWILLNILLKHVLPVVESLPLPLSPLSILSWLGFTDEGSPCYMDSVGIIRQLYGRSSKWIPIYNVRDQLPKQNDCCFPIGINETGSTLRCVICRDSSYPITLPLPTVTSFPLNMPICENLTEYRKLEEICIKQNLLLESYKARSMSCFATNAERELSKQLIKLFALCCKAGYQNRAEDVAKLMPTSFAVQLALKYATRQHMQILADHLSTLILSFHETSNLNCKETNTADHSWNEQYAVVNQTNEDSSINNSFLTITQEQENIQSSNSSLSLTPHNPFKKSFHNEASEVSKGPLTNNIFDTLLNNKEQKKNKIHISDVKKSHFQKMSDKKSVKQNKTGFQKWLEENKEQLLKENPGITHEELTKIAILEFRALSNELKKVYNSDEFQPINKKPKQV